MKDTFLSLLPGGTSFGATQIETCKGKKRLIQNPQSLNELCGNRLLPKPLPVHGNAISLWLDTRQNYRSKQTLRVLATPA